MGELCAPPPTPGEIAAHFRYDRETGEFYNVRSGHGVRAGDLAGSIDADGYRILVLRGRRLKAHLVVWLLETGEWAPGRVDHRNRRPSENRFSNLRVATVGEQLANRAMQRNNATGAKGVTVVRGSLPYWARISVDGTRISLGYFATREAAASAYAAAAATHFGEFACSEAPR